MFNGGEFISVLADDKEYLEEIVKAVPFLIDQEGDIINLHSSRVALLASSFAADVLEANRTVVTMAGLYHDIGAVGSNIHPARARTIVDFFSNPWLSNHPIRAAQVLKKINYFQHMTNIVLEHHEWYDGGGFPFGRKGSEILPESQALRVADAYDVAMLVSGSSDLAFEILKRAKGREIDEDLYIIFKHYITANEFDFMWKDGYQTLSTILNFWKKIKLEIGLEDVLQLLKVFELKSKPHPGHFIRVAFMAEKAWEEMCSTDTRQAARAALLHEVYTGYEPFKGSYIGSLAKEKVLEEFPLLNEAYLDLEKDPVLSEMINILCITDRILYERQIVPGEKELVSILAEFNGRINPEILLAVKNVILEHGQAIYASETLKAKFS